MASRAPSVSRRAARRRAPLLALLAVILLAAGVTEASLKAAFVYNFTRLVTWSQASLGAKTDPFVVGVVGKNGLGEELEAALANKSAVGRPIVVRRWPTADDIGRCQILWVSPEIVADDDGMRKVLSQRDMLVVGDAETIASRGGMVRLFREETGEGMKIRFEVNVEAARAAGLEVSSKLLSLARIVTSTVPEHH